jgi:Tfp pilus assembly protein PilF
MEDRSERHDGGGFAFHFERGSAVLRLERQRIEPFARLETLELSIPNVSLPLDISHGVGGLRNRRLRLTRLRMSAPIEELVAAASRAAEGPSLDGLTAELTGSAITVLAQLGPPRRRVRATFRLVLAPHDGDLAFTIDEARCYGPLAVPLIRAPFEVLRAIGWFELEGVVVRPRALLRTALFRLLPPRGWRLPECADVALSGVEVARGRAAIEYAALGANGGTLDAPAGGAELSWLKRCEELRALREGDRLLAVGSGKEAREAYARVAAGDPTGPASIARLASLDVAAKELLAQARAAVAQARARCPERSDLAAVAAHGAALSNDGAAEAEALVALSARATALERYAASMRLGDLFAERDPAAAVSHFEAALSERNEDPAALEALAALAARVKDRERFDAFVARWVTASPDPERLAEANARAGRLLVERFGDPAAGVDRLERAVIAAPDNREAHLDLARALYASGEIHRAIALLDGIESRARADGNSVAAAGALAAAGEIWFRAGEPGLAAARFREALELTETGGALRVSLARALAASGLFADAAAEYAAALETARPGGEEFPWHEAALEDAEKALAAGEFAAALELASAAGSGSQVLRPRAASIAARAATFVGMAPEATKILERVAMNADGAAAAALLLEAARISAGAMGDVGRARIFLEAASVRAPKSREVREELVGILERGGDRVALARALARGEGDDAARIAELKRAADYFLAEGLRGEAVGALQRAFVVARDADTARMLSDALWHGGEREASVERLRPFVAKDARCRDLLGERLEACGENREAAALWLEAAQRAGAQADRRRHLESARRAARAAGAEDLLAACAPLALVEAESAAGQGAWRTAEEMLSAAIDGARGEDRARLRRRRAAIRRSRLGDEDGAISDLLAVREASDLSPAELEELVSLLEARGRLAEASGALAGLVDEPTCDAKRMERAARLAAAAGDEGAARGLWRRVVERAPEIGAVIELVKLLDPARDREELARLLRDLSGKEPFLDIPDHVALLEARVGLDLVDGRDEDAIAGLTEVLLVAPEAIDPWQRLVQILERRGEWEALAARMEERLSLGVPRDDVAQTAFALGCVRADKLGDEAAAVAAFERALAVDPGNLGAHEALARIAFRQRRFFELERHLAFTAGDVSATEVALWRAAVHEHAGEPDEAREIYLGIVRREPSNGEAVEGLCRTAEGPEHDPIVLEIGRSARGEGALEAAPPVVRRLGQALLRRGEVDLAIEALTRADRLTDGDAETLRSLCDAHAISGDFAAAAQTRCRLALRLEGRERAEHLVAAARMCLDHSGEIARAWSWLESAAEIAPDDPDVLLGLADCAAAKGDHEATVRFLERFRLVARGRPLDPRRTHAFAVALTRTRAWPLEDIAEMLEGVLERLAEAERIRAEQLVALIRRGGM